MNGPYLRTTPDGLTLAPDPKDRTRLALVRIFLAPPLLTLLGGLLWLVYDIPVEAVALGVVAFCVVLVPMGLVGLLTAGSAARKAAVAIGAEGVTLPGGRVLRKEAVTRVVVAQPSPMMKWEGIFVVNAAGARTLLLGGLPPGRGKEIAATAEALATHLGVPVEIPQRVRLGRRVSLEGRGAAALCYVPLQGIGLGVSLAALGFGVGPEVRFAARQSLLFWAISVAAVVLLLAVGIGGAFAVGAFEPDAGPGGLLVLVLVTVPPLLLRVGLGFTAAFLTYRRGYWVIPGLGGLSRRWLPAESGVS